ncbi:hypothetical protein HY636_04540 [Candidatus Woesearchaeota archaeon]|nr:hypothetical protein [Candidatus Woesearchaeota archaeon]
MNEKNIQTKLLHMPTLKTILMVEKALENMPGSVMTFAELKRALPKKVNHNTLKEIVDYLDKSNKIYIGVKGITWIHNPSLKLKKAIENGFEH